MFLFVFQCPLITTKLISRHLSNPWPLLVLLILFLHFVPFPHPKGVPRVSESSGRSGCAWFSTHRSAAPEPRVLQPKGLQGWGTARGSLRSGPRARTCPRRAQGRGGGEGMGDRGAGGLRGMAVTHPVLSPLSWVGRGQRPRYDSVKGVVREADQARGDAAHRRSSGGAREPSARAPARNHSRRTRSLHTHRDCGSRSVRFHYFHRGFPPRKRSGPNSAPALAPPRPQGRGKVVRSDVPLRS